ncbi:MFS transporter [Ottowia sp.]|uniref:MFS transporter n=1 Tax=Ottowia sp. TaxID=1898956 RepID=UPI0026289668|nr:MFS transporter [Ottowia sp.]
MTGEPAAPAQAPQLAPVVTDDGLPQPQRRRAIVTILLGIAVAVLDGTIVTLALPRIATDFHATAASSIWIVNAYQLAVLVTLIPCAALGDRFGYRRVYLCGVATMLVTSLGAMLAPSMPALIAWRAVQGMGAAGIMGVNAALVRLTYPRPLLGRGMALNSVTVAVASVAGPTLAAAILSHTSWHWLFGINLPLGLGLLWLGQRSLPPHRSPTPARLHPLDVLLNAAMFSLVFLGVEQLGTRAGAGSLDARAAALAVALLLGGLVVGVVFVRGQLRRDVPLLPVDLMRIPVFALSMCTSVTAFAAQALGQIAMPFLLLVNQGRSAAETGLLMAAWPVGSMATAPVAGRLTGRYNAGVLSAIGMAVMAVGLASLALLPAAPTHVDIGWRLALCGAGFALFQTPNNFTIVTSAPASRAGGAGGMLGTARLTGQSAGAVLLAIVLATASQQSGPTLALGLGAACAVAAGLFSLSRRSGIRAAASG